jgi:hypothetical protein
MHTGCQWSQIPIDKDETGKPEINYTRLFRAFSYWVRHGCFNMIFESSVLTLFKAKLLDMSVLHGDSTCTVAKKGEII